MAESHHIAKTPVPHNARFIDLTGQRFGKLTVIGYSHRDPKSNRACRTVRCDCGKVLTQDGTRLRNGSVKSCGCLIGESAKQRFTKHGKSFSPEWRSWRAMNNRCHNPNHKSYNHYHRRGITVCEEWRKSFEAFWKHVGDCPSPYHTLERINNRKGYFPGNVRWATRQEQALNRD